MISGKVHLIAFGIIIIILITGCDPKQSPFFSPDFSVNNDDEDMFPSTEMIIGQWEITYLRQDYTCSGTQPEFTSEASAMSSSPTSLMYQFADAPAPISGMYDPSTGAFNGSTGEVDRGDGSTVSESWMVNFNYSNNPLNVTFEGESEVLLKDSSGNTLCFVNYLIDGLRF
jgi:hypothetical protein